MAPKKSSRLGPLLVLGTLGVSAIYFMGKPTEEDQEKGALTYPKRAWHRAAGFFTSFEEPAFEKLLPDPVKDPQHPRPYTLVVDLDKFLVCHIWDREQGRWRIAKRPGAEQFLFYAAQLYEIVVFSSLPQHEGDTIVKKLDPYGCISHSLFRFATKHRKGVYLKDIGHLNRDLAKVVVMGHDQPGFAQHPENFIKMKSWEGDPDDLALEQSIDFLEMLAFSKLGDVRSLIRHYGGQQFPEAFDASQRQIFDKTQEANQSSLQSKLGHWLGLGGLSARKGATATAPAERGPSYEERKRERIELRRGEYARIKELMQRQLEAEMKKEKEYYAEHKMALWDLFARGPPPPPPPSDSTAR